jgi:hypothetical protein
MDYTDMQENGGVAHITMIDSYHIIANYTFGG